MRKRTVIVLLCLLVLMIPTTNAYAFEEDLQPREIDLGDGLIFHITPTEHEELGYPPTGLYRNGEVVYLLEHSGYIRGRLFFSDDGLSFLVVNNEWRGRDTTFIRFYKNGIREHRHEVHPLLADGGDSLSPYICFIGPHWIEDGSTQYDRENNFLQFTTVDGNKVTFDLTTGLITSQNRVFTFGLLPVSIIVPLVIASTLIVIFLLTKKKNIHSYTRKK